MTRPRPGTRWACPASGEQHTVEAVADGFVAMRYGTAPCSPWVGGMELQAWRAAGFVRVRG